MRCDSIGPRDTAGWSDPRGAILWNNFKSILDSIYLNGCQFLSKRCHCRLRNRNSHRISVHVNIRIGH